MDKNPLLNLPTEEYCVMLQQLSDADRKKRIDELAEVLHEVVVVEAEVTDGTSQQCCEKDVSTAFILMVVHPKRELWTHAIESMFERDAAAPILRLIKLCCTVMDVKYAEGLGAL